MTHQTHLHNEAFSTHSTSAASHVCGERVRSTSANFVSSRAGRSIGADQNEEIRIQDEIVVLRQGDYKSIAWVANVCVSQLLSSTPFSTRTTSERGRHEWGYFNADDDAMIRNDLYLAPTV